MAAWLCWRLVGQVHISEYPSPLGPPQLEVGTRRQQAQSPGQEGTPSIPLQHYPLVIYRVAPPGTAEKMAASTQGFREQDVRVGLAKLGHASGVTGEQVTLIQSPSA